VAVKDVLHLSRKGTDVYGTIIRAIVRIQTHHNPIILDNIVLISLRKCCNIYDISIYADERPKMYYARMIGTRLALLN